MRPQTPVGPAMIAGPNRQASCRPRASSWSAELLDVRLVLRSGREACVIMEEWRVRIASLFRTPWIFKAHEL